MKVRMMMMMVANLKNKISSRRYLWQCLWVHLVTVPRKFWKKELLISSSTMYCHLESLSDSFIQLIESASGKKFTMSRRTLTRKTEEKFKRGVTSLKDNLEEPLYVAPTTDAWSCWNKSYLGVTVHWIDPHTLIRKNGVIACRRLKGKHTYNVLAKEIENIHIQFGIRDKTCATTTDNGGNFIKAFNLFGESLSEKKLNRSQASARPSIYSDSEEEDDVNESETAIEDLTTILDQGLQSLELEDCEYYALPNHVRCASHTLNLVTTIDSNNVMDHDSNKDYKKKSRDRFSVKPKLCGTNSQKPPSIRCHQGRIRWII